jgi:hypothetical protein
MTHVPLWVEYPGYVRTICLGEAQGHGRLNLRELAPEWEPHHPRLGGTIGSFALRSLLQRDHPDATMVGICQYRKFVSNQRISRVAAKSFRVMDVVTRPMVSAAPMTDLMLPAGTTPFLFSRPRWFNNRRRSGSYLRQYGIAHRSEDFLRLTAEAVSLGVIEGREVDAFFGEQLFVPGGIELGVYPADFWLKAIAAVEAVARACVERDPSPNADAEKRALSFCIERLGSWLLLRHLGATSVRRFSVSRVGWFRPSHWSRQFVGQLNLVTEEGQTRYVPGS